MQENEIPRDRLAGLRRIPLSWVFFPLALLYHELLLRAFDPASVFFDGALLPIALAAIGGGLLLSLLCGLLPWRKTVRWVSLCLTLLWSVFVCVQYCCKSYFKTYFALTFMVTMTGHVVGDFAATILEIILTRLPFILLAMLPLVLAIVLRRRIVPEARTGRTVLLVMAGLSVLTIGGSAVLFRLGPNAALYTYDFNTDSAVSKFGLGSSLGLELTYALTGTPAPPLPSLPQPEEPVEDVTPEPVVYGYNTLDIDFAALADSASNSTLSSIHRYVASRTPSRQNEYTGMFKGKNLILLTAEAFSPWFISEELTPTLYRLTHEGFVCTNYYQPGWGQSTTGGEFAVLTGLLPTWIDNNVSFWASRNDYMPLALGNQFRALGYQTPAWHDNTYNYYNRDATHPNLGYDYQGIGNGLTLPSSSGSGWPYSDLEMMEATMDSYVDTYLATGQPFHAYYMTVSGHGGYGWGHAMAAKNRAAAQAAYPDASTPVQAYVAANLELEAALTYMLEKLEVNGIADDTVICLSADHYPYILAEADADYYVELTGRQDTELDTSRYRNALILWCGSMEEPVTVDIPCSAVDIVPTLSNLFGLPYDSRLLSGRDILDDSYNAASAGGSIPLVILPTVAGNSWATAAGVYEARSRTFTPAPGVTVAEDYVDSINALIPTKYTYAKLMIQYDYYRTVLGGDDRDAKPPRRFERRGGLSSCIGA